MKNLSHYLSVHLIAIAIKSKTFHFNAFCVGIIPASKYYIVRQ